MLAPPLRVPSLRPHDSASLEIPRAPCSPGSAGLYARGQLCFSSHLPFPGKMVSALTRSLSHTHTHTHNIHRHPTSTSCMQTHAHRRSPKEPCCIRCVHSLVLTPKGGLLLCRDRLKQIPQAPALWEAARFLSGISAVYLQAASPKDVRERVSGAPGPALTLDCSAKAPLGPRGLTCQVGLK